jgi:hypothetical protein
MINDSVGRELIKMDMSALPYRVREWLKRESLQRHFSVQDDVVFFAPGAIYPILPLWVDEPEDASIGECEGTFPIFPGLVWEFESEMLM